MRFPALVRYIKMQHICIAFSLGLLLAGCLNTEGTLEIKGKVIDEYTKKQIPGRDIIIQGLVRSGEKLVPVDAGQFSSDSSGCFTYKLRKVNYAYYYNFCLAGDSDYASKVKMLGLLELQQNAKFLSFSLSKLVDLTIIINRNINTSVWDTLSLSWKSNGVYDRNLYPWKIINYAKTDNSPGLKSDIELRWIGGKVNSVINTRVYAYKKTTLLWELDRNGRRQELTDTITCNRDFKNFVYFTY